MSVRFQSLTRKSEIDANCYLLESSKIGILLDAGMHPKAEGILKLPQLNQVEDKPIDAIILSHAHLDHSGAIPYLLQQHPKALVYATQATRLLAEAVWHNSVNIMIKKRDELDIAEYPFFTHDQVNAIMDRILVVPLKKTISLPHRSGSLTFFDAGHILGSIGCLIELDKKRIFYTGDLHLNSQNLIKKANFPKKKTFDALIIETTKGNTETSLTTRQDEQKRFLSCIEKTLDRGGSVLIPVFAIGKTQEILTMLYEFRKMGKLQKIPVFIGGLSIKMTKIYDRLHKSTPRNHPKLQLLKTFNISAKKKSAKPLVYQRKAIFALSSGMMIKNTVSHQMSEHFLSDPKNSILFVGYNDSETPGYVVENSKLGDVIELDEKTKVVRKCDVHSFDFSAHANRNDLLDFMEKNSASSTFLVHGDRDSAQWFSQQLTQHNPKANPIIPKPLESYSI